MFNSKIAGIIILITAVLFSSCVKKEKFTPKGWDAGGGLEFPKREGMVDDLLQNHKLKGLTYKQVVQLLKAPQRNSFTDRSFSYEIIRKMSGIDTLYIRNLVFYLNPDSVVVNTKIVERDYKKEKEEREEKAKK